MKVILNYAQYKYLKDNGILEQYKKNVIADRTEHPHDSDFSGHSYFIAPAFLWDNTEEGHDFWYHHDNESMDLKSNDLYTLKL